MQRANGRRRARHQQFKLFAAIQLLISSENGSPSSVYGYNFLISHVPQGAIMNILKQPIPIEAHDDLPRKRGRGLVHLISFGNDVSLPHCPSAGE